MLEQLRLDLGHRRRARRRRLAAPRARHRGRRSTAGRRTGSRRAPRAAAAGDRRAAASASPCRSSSSGSTSRRRRSDAPHPGEVVEPDVVDEDALGRDAQEPCDLALDADRDVAEADRAMARIEQRAGHDPHRVREVHDPGVRLRERADPLGDLEHDRHGAHRLREARRRRSSPGRCIRRRAGPSRPGAVPPARRRGVCRRTNDARLPRRRGRRVTFSVPPNPCRSSMRAAISPTTVRRSSSMSCRTSSSHRHAARARARGPRRAPACTSSPPPTTASFIP